MIPKIIHHTAPTDASKWHPMWWKCLESWKTQFPEPEYKHIIWNDEQIDSLVKDHYPEYYDLYKSFAFDIIRIDFVRFCMLHLHGGIYADMDFYCYKNFYHELKDDVVMLEAAASDEILQNSMMASTKGNSFIEYCMEETKRLFYPHHTKLDKGHYVKDICGPYFLSRCYMTYPKKPQLLDAARYNPHHMTYHESYMTKHMLTGMWGSDVIKDFDRNRKPDESFADHVKNSYLGFRKLDINNLDFYKNY